jgi:hypothetical protein
MTTTAGPTTTSITSNNIYTTGINNRVPSPPLNYDYSVITSDTDPAATLLLDAKNEYNKQLISHLRQPVFNLMKGIYNTSEDICHQENTPENVLMVFQDNLAQVPKWSKTRRTKEYNEFLKISSCDWFNELIKFCYITHVKILTIVNKPRPDIKLSISIPSGNTFYHSVCVAVARELWRSPFLFNKNVGGRYEYQKNMRLIEQIIDNSVDACIRAHIPMKAILTEYLDNDVSVPSTPNENKLHLTQKPEPQDTQSNPSLPLSAGSSARIPKPSKLKLTDELDAFLDSPLEPKNDLESINFTKPDELVDELEIIQPALIDDEFNPTTPTNILNNNCEIDELSEVILAPSQSATQTNSTKQKSTTDVINQDSDLQSNIEPDEFMPKADLPVAKADLPVAKADLPVAKADLPVAKADLPVAKADLPVAKADLPVAKADLPVAKADHPVANADLPVAKADHPVANADHPVSKPNDINEFDLDSLPEISLASITQIAEPDKPTTPVSVIDNISEHIPNLEIKHIPLTDMNEPGQILPHQELKQPMSKKKLIVEDLGINELEEVPLTDKLNEIKTFKNTANIPYQHTNNKVINRQEFAFF